jgi:hypothetical protein
MGPLSDAALLDPSARDALPLARHFDGIAWSWRAATGRPSDDVSFKAGDNFGRTRT